MPEASGSAPKPDADGGDKKTESDVDDAVLQMAMAMSEDEVVYKANEKKEDEGFDFNIIIQLFWIGIIIYSFGSSIIGIATGRIQDRTGGDFTPYDFFDNIVSFREWDLEYSLGFDPIKKFNELKQSMGK